MKKKLHMLYKQIIHTTPCLECYRGRLSLFYILGGLSSIILNGYAVAIIGAMALIIFIGRKNNWWLEDE